MLKEKRAYCHPPTPQSNVTNSFIRQYGSNFDIPHDAWLISISSHETEEPRKQGLLNITIERGRQYQP